MIGLGSKQIAKVKVPSEAKSMQLVCQRMSAGSRRRENGPMEEDFSAELMANERLANQSETHCLGLAWLSYPES